MMSLLALSGLTALGMGDLPNGDEGSEDDQLPDDLAYEDFDRGDQDFEDGLMSYVWQSDGDTSEFEEHVQSDQNSIAINQVDLDRGSEIDVFDPDNDVLEVEYTAALGLPEVTVIDFEDGTGASIALNGVAVVDVAGAQGLNPEIVALVAI